MRRRVAAIAVVLFAAAVLAGCGSSDNGGTVSDGGSTDATTTTAASGTGTAAAKKVEVKAADFSFDPTAIALTAGEDVQFVIASSGAVKHNLTVEGLGVNQDVEPGKTAEAPLTKALKAGSYKYHCEYHPDQMKGTITVT